MDDKTVPVNTANETNNSFGNNPSFIIDTEKDVKEGIVTNVRNYVEVRNLIYNLVLYILANPADEKCKAYIREEFSPVFTLYLDEIKESDKSKLISFFRDYNQAFEDVCTTRPILNRTVFESRYNRFRQYALATILDPKNSSDFPKPKYKGTASLTIKEIALKLAYEYASVTEANMDFLAESFGHTSGRKLYLEFNRVNTPSKRISDPDQTRLVLENKIKRVKKVIEILADEFKAKASDEVKILEIHLSRY
jgi:hypothetical protein